MKRAGFSLSDEGGVRTQFALWGYAITGDICNDVAVIAEDKNVAMIVPLAWDHDVKWLHTQLVAHGDEPYHHPPEWWCLPNVSSRVMFGELEAARCGGVGPLPRDESQPAERQA